MGPLEDKLSIYSWGGLRRPIGAEGFHRWTLGPAITLDSFASNEEMISKLVAAKGTSGYDIIVPTGPFIPQMIENGLLTKLNLELIPNIKYMDPAFLEPGLRHGATITASARRGEQRARSSTTRETSSPASSPRGTTSSTPRRNEASGKTSCLDDPSADGRGHLLLRPPALPAGRTTDAADLDACEEFMVNELAPHVTAFDSYPGGAAIPQATHALMQAWNGDARIGVQEGSPDPERVGSGCSEPPTPNCGWTTGRSRPAHPTPRPRTPSSTSSSIRRTRCRT